MIESRVVAPVRHCPEWAWLPVLALLGVLAGIAAKAADESGIAWAADLGTFPAAWVLAVAGAAVAAWWGTRRPGPFAGALMAMAAGIALAGGSLQRLYWVWTGDLSPLAARPVQAAVDVLVAAALTVVLPRHRATRGWALALALPLAGLASALLQRLYQWIG